MQYNKLASKYYLVFERFDFTDFEGYRFEYTLSLDGKTFESRNIFPKTAPHNSFIIVPEVKVPTDCRLGCFATVKMFDGEDFEIGCMQIAMPVEVIENKAEGEALVLKEEAFAVIAEGKDFSYVISKQTGTLVSAKRNSKELLAEPMAISCFRAYTDNDRDIVNLWNNINIWQGENLDCTFNKVYSAETAENTVKTTGSLAGVSRQPFLRYTLSYTFFTDGQIAIALDGKVKKETIWLPDLYHRNIHTFRLKPQQTFHGYLKTFA